MRFGAISLLIALLMFFCVVSIVHSVDKVKIEYFYSGFQPDCPTCADPNVARVNQVITQIELSYGEQVEIEWLDILTSEGREKWNSYSLGLFSPTVVINPTSAVNSTYIMKEPDQPITKETLADAIDAYLGKTDTNPLSLFVRSFERLVASEIFLAFSLGLMNGFSPCLLAMLAFILTYSAGTSASLKVGLIRSITFALGLVTAIVVAAILILPVGFYFLFQLTVYLQAITVVIAVILTIVGLNLIGVLNLPISSAPLIQRLAKDYFFSNLAGLYALGILFFFVKVPCALFGFFILLATHFVTEEMAINLSLFLAFSLGIMVPIIGVGVVGSGAPKLAREIVEKHRLKIRALSGLVLIVYATYLVLWQVLM